MANEPTQPLAPVSTASTPPSGSINSVDPNIRYYFVNFTADDTAGVVQNIWLFDKDKKTFHPFPSVEAARAFNPEAFDKKIITISDPMSSPDFSGLFLSMDYTL